MPLFDLLIGRSLEIYRQSHDDVHFLRAICALAMVPGFSEPFLRAETGL
jgi:hypothetical protein